jgi:Arc/MetJ family transcription regulator
MKPVSAKPRPNNSFHRARAGGQVLQSHTLSQCKTRPRQPPPLTLVLPHLTCMHNQGMLMHMRTTLNIDDSLLRNAAKLTGVKEKTSLVRLGLEALIAKESARRLANLGGTEKHLRAIRRRRPRNAA